MINSIIAQMAKKTGGLFKKKLQDSFKKAAPYRGQVYGSPG
jgi:hypothetical protein